MTYQSKLQNQQKYKHDLELQIEQKKQIKINELKKFKHFQVSESNDIYEKIVKGGRKSVFDGNGRIINGNKEYAIWNDYSENKHEDVIRNNPLETNIYKYENPTPQSNYNSSNEPNLNVVFDFKTKSKIPKLIEKKRNNKIVNCQLPNIKLPTTVIVKKVENISFDEKLHNAPINKITNKIVPKKTPVVENITLNIKMQKPLKEKYHHQRIQNKNTKEMESNKNTPIRNSSKIITKSFGGLNLKTPKDDLAKFLQKLSMFGDTLKNEKMISGKEIMSFGVN